MIVKNSSVKTTDQCVTGHDSSRPVLTGWLFVGVYRAGRRFCGCCWSAWSSSGPCWPQGSLVPWAGGCWLPRPRCWRHPQSNPDKMKRNGKWPRYPCTYTVVIHHFSPPLHIRKCSWKSDPITQLFFLVSFVPLLNSFYSKCVLLFQMLYWNCNHHK